MILFEVHHCQKEDALLTVQRCQEQNRKSHIRNSEQFHYFDIH
jgi:hypothetical protein